MSKKQIKPLVLKYTTEKQIAEFYFNREFSTVPLETVKNDEGFYEIMKPSERFLVKEYLSEYADVGELLEEFYGSEVHEDLEELDEHELEEFEDYVTTHAYFQDWAHGDWYATNEPMWGYVFRCPDFYVDSNYMDVDKLKAIGLGVIDHETGYYLYVSGAGYDFYEAHWIPLFKALDWIEEVEVLTYEDDFVRAMLNGSDYAGDDIVEFAKEHLQNLVPMEDNIANFIEWSESKKEEKIYTQSDLEVELFKLAEFYALASCKSEIEMFNQYVKDTYTK